MAFIQRARDTRRKFGIILVLEYLAKINAWMRTIAKKRNLLIYRSFNAIIVFAMPTITLDVLRELTEIFANDGENTKYSATFF